MTKPSKYKDEDPKAYYIALSLIVILLTSCGLALFLSVQKEYDEVSRVNKSAHSNTEIVIGGYNIDPYITP